MPGVPPLGENEYWIAREDASRWLMEGVYMLVSPLDTENIIEVEISDEQDVLLNWLVTHNVQHIRVVE